MELKKAALVSRFLAALIDGIIGGVFMVVPMIGAIVSVVYLLLKDGIMFEVTKQDQWKNRSIGKKIMGLQVTTLDESTVDLAISAKRNIPLTIGSLIALIPVIGWVIGPLVALVFAIVELVIILTDNQGRRLGDKWANTCVIETQATRQIDSVN